MAETITVARPYAEAAFRVAKEKSTLGPWAQALELLEFVVTDSNVAGCIGDPKISGQQLKNLVLGVCGERLDGPARNFVEVLVDNGRLALMPEIRRSFEDLKRAHEGTLEAQIYSAFALDEEQTGQLVRRLESRYRRKVSAQVSVDPQLIGGVKIVVGDQVLDATVRGRLDAMAAALAH